jgi:hypothetical protein
MAQQNLEDQLEEKLRQASDQAKALGYNPSYFVQMLNREGAINTVNHLLATNKYAQDLTTLYILQALHLTVEAIILEEPYSQLFTEDQLNIARVRLKKLGYKFS